MAITDDRSPAFTAETGGFERQPPQDIAAEQSVLGGMLLSKDAIADVVEVLRPGDFYRPAHQAVYDCILDLYGRGEPADPITVSAELERRGELTRVGGAPYLHTLIATVPTAANAGYYARIVAEKAILRRLVEAGTRIVQYGYGADNNDGGDINEVVDRAQSAIYEVTERRTSEDYVALEELLQPTMDEIDAIASRGGVSLGIPTGFTDLDEVTNGLHPGQMIIIAARPGVGKSTLGLDFARSCSIKHGMTSAIFSLEMSRTEIVMRMLSAEAKIRLADMRGGRMTDDDWTRLARRMSEISEAPLFIDDSPNLTMMEIRAKARRLKQRNDLKLVVVDYMQLMTSGKRVESRQQEVSEFSRQLKLLAKELEVPVVAISQLNRGPEQRTDKRPMLADLRESGCLTAATRLLRADTGAEVSFGELMRTGERPIVWSLDERMRLVARPITNVFSSGVKEVFKVRLASGREIEATGNHPMLTVDGWSPLRQLSIGSRVAVPRRTPEPLAIELLPQAEVIMLAHLIGDGSFVKRQPIRYASTDEENLRAVSDAAKHFGVTAVRDEYTAARVTTLRLPAPYHLTHGKRNPIAAWLDELGLFGLRSHEKFVPERIFSLPKEQIALFLRHIWATDGSVGWDETAGQARLYYATTSRRLADDIVRLLARIDVFARIKRTTKSGYRVCYHVLVYGAENQLAFLEQAGCHGARALRAEVAKNKLRAITGNTNLDTVPKEVWSRVRELLSVRSMTHRDFAERMDTPFCGSTMWKHAPSRTRLAKAAAVLNDAELDMLATNDVFWDEIVEITSLGEQQVYDATVDQTHNFVANGIVLHNSLEQDADMVMLIHRPDAWERDDPRAGEADLILAKHRAGPTSTISVAHQLHYSRFTDLAHD
ncbi:replicative DNA helicase [Saccharomonospora azurea]|uniref:Replicative DNA helicase n=1 Tax=Saccharomonospora azurea NA-128 TaxID=882081 RepID=H8GAC9_9PSEU|nr:replicative DNA helicase [Saccharomonospora azurea]EHK84504.1 replicative DNA helicase [Saccharomonospora azurea SZMC 14600]EHY89626.1 replicative DNA helicase [Saccharomonospora azurea NA-128]